MAKDYFSVPIFLICFREVLEAAIILSVLFALVEQVVKRPGGIPGGPANPASHYLARPECSNVSTPDCVEESDDPEQSFNPVHTGGDGEATYDGQLIKRLRIQIISGTIAGLFVALCIGTTFLVIYYTQFNDLYGNSEELWEGIFSLVACVMIFIMGIGMLQMDRSKIKWRVKLAEAFEAQEAIKTKNESAKFSPKAFLQSIFGFGRHDGTWSTRSSKYLLFFLPAATVLREGLEAVVFIGGVSLGQPASSIPIAAIAGIVLGLIIGYVVYKSSARLNLSIFLVISTIFLMYIGAGLVTKATWFFTMYRFIQTVGGDAAEAGDGPGSFPVDGYIWHLNYGNPENKLTAGGWTIFSGVFGWNNTGTIATILVYCGFWLLVSVTLIYLKWGEGRCVILTLSSATRKRRLQNLRLPSVARVDEVELESSKFPQDQHSRLGFENSSPSKHQFDPSP